ncbi:MAG TPA: M50 family metallopeptidase [Candidatus Paceibacterota bacterium]|nr:M50 family metallopeptidase [Candidatus Paceibacterota bacterium]
MIDISLGIVIVLITAFGYLSNTLNWRYLNYGVVRFLYYIGALVHETSHAVLCIVTGAKIEEFTVFSNQPRVVHRKSKLPFLGELLISAAPIAGGLLFLFLVNRYLLGNYFAPPHVANWHDWRSVLAAPLEFLSQINILQWQSWVMILLLFNAGAMLGPSTQDLKNVWPMLIILFFINSPLLAGIGLAALSLIMANIVLQIVVILLLSLMRLMR